MNDINVTLTQDDWIASRPPEVRALFEMPDPVLRQQRAEELYEKGFILCNEIDVLNGSAPLVMFMLAQMGLKWTPSFHQPNLVLAGGIAQQITKIDVDHPWPNSITVSVNLADYPPHDPAVVPVKEPMVGIAYNDGTYSITAAAIDAEVHGALKKGSVITENGKQWKYNILSGGFLNRRWWEVVA